MQNQTKSQLETLIYNVRYSRMADELIGTPYIAHNVIDDAPVLCADYEVVRERYKGSEPVYRVTAWRKEDASR